jgi:hypothetical protein
MAKKPINNGGTYNVSGDPTKDLFITMLIKDISLRDAIGDLVDNSVDAIKAKAENRNDLSGYEIEITANSKVFSIKDNGCGIEEEVARKYAFKLGRPKKYKLPKHSIGRFGIGMKRAFFKLGNDIHVESIAPKSRFSIDIPVKTWKMDEDEWNFKFTNVEPKETNSPDITGTTIVIKDLAEDAKDNFKRIQFENDLIDEIAREQVLNISKGLKIIINENPLIPEPITFKYNDEVKPVYWKHIFKHINIETQKPEDLSVEIVAGVDQEKDTGIGPDDEKEGGWNIFCNERLIIDRDTSEITGWTGKGGDGVAKYHQQFWGFRGCVFFDANDSSLLPWNTTKTGIDPESSDYIAVRKKMIEIMKDVFLLFNRQKTEREGGNPQTSQVLNNKINAAVRTPILQILKDKSKLPPKFTFPKDLNAVKEKDLTVIRYKVPSIKFGKVKKRLESPSPSDAGSKTFDYYYNNEIGD